MENQSYTANRVYRLTTNQKLNIDEAYLDKNKATKVYEELKRKYTKDTNVSLQEYEFITTSNNEVGDNVYIFTSRTNINCRAVEDLAFANEDNANNYNKLTLEILKLKVKRNWEMFGYNVLSVYCDKTEDNFYSKTYPGLTFVNVELDNNTMSEYFTHIKKIPLIK